MGAIFKLYFIGMVVVSRQGVDAAGECEGEELDAAIAFCSPLNDTNGIYQLCFDDVPPLETYTDCLNDHCADPNLACDTMLLYEQECTDYGETGYTSVLDACGVCHGDGSSCSLAPTTVPTTRAPTPTPTSKAPTATPTSKAPTATPTFGPTAVPTTSPTVVPTTEAPTKTPTAVPTTKAPTPTPTFGPTAVPTTEAPTAAPTSGGTDTTKLIIGFGVGGGVLLLVGVGAVVAMSANKHRLPTFSGERTPIVETLYT